MNILLVNLPWQNKQRWGIRAGSRWPFTTPKAEGQDIPPYLPFPFYLAYASALLKKKGFSAQVLDAVALGWGESRFFGFLNSRQFNVFVIETSTPSFNNDLDYAEKIKSIFPYASIIFTGPHSSVFAEDILRQNSFVDFIIKGEYEYSLLNLLKSWQNPETWPGISGLVFRSRSGIVNGPLNQGAADINALPWPDRESLPILNYQDRFCGLKHPCLQIWASRGCPFRCVFCLWPKVMYGQGPYRLRNPEDIIAEIKWCLARWNFKSVYFDDDTFNINRPHVEAIAKGFIANKIGIPWACMCRADFMDRGLLELLKKSGLYAVKYGIESADSKILEFSRKNLDLAKAEKTVKLTKKLGIKVHLTFTFGLWGETRQSIKRTIKFAFGLKPDSLQFSIVTPFPGTEYFDFLSRKGLISSYNWDDYDGYKSPVFHTNSLTEEDLVSALDRAAGLWKKYYIRRRQISQAKQKIKKILGMN